MATTIEQRARRGTQLQAAADALERALRDADLEVGRPAWSDFGGDTITAPPPRWSVALVEELIAAGVLALPAPRGA